MVAAERIGVPNMKDDLNKVMSAVLDSTKPPPTVTPAQFIALRTLVTAILAMIASQRERSLAGDGRAWINDVSAVCQDAILNADIRHVGSLSAEDLRREAMEQVNDMLSSVMLANNKRPSFDN
jgi:hypothetical protein